MQKGHLSAYVTAVTDPDHCAIRCAPPPRTSAIHRVPLIRSNGRLTAIFPIRAPSKIVAEGRYWIR